MERWSCKLHLESKENKFKGKKMNDDYYQIIIMKLFKTMFLLIETVLLHACSGTEAKIKVQGMLSKK